MKALNCLFIVFIISMDAGYAYNSGIESAEMGKIETGDTVPQFKLKNQDGKWVNINSLLGSKNLVIYFYPHDGTPGCTKQACTFRDEYEKFKDADAEVIGISSQSVKSHKKFAAKYDLPFILLSDEKDEVREKFGVPSGLFGLIPGRVTYVVNKKGRVVYIFNSMSDVEQHVENALNILKKLD